MDIRNILSLAGVTLVLGVAGWYWGLDRQPIAPESDERRPDFIIQGIETIETDNLGQLRHRMFATEARHYQRPAEEAEVDNPILFLYENGQEAWKISAEKTSALSQNTEIFLEGNVRAERRSPGTIPITFDTPGLTVFPKEERLQGRQLVTVKSPRGNLQSTGIQASIKTGELFLPHHVKGSYAPPSR